MSYVKNVLTNDETIIYQGKVSLWSLFPAIMLGLFLLPFNGIGLLFWIWAGLIYATTEAVITNKRVVAKYGIISRHTVELNMKRIESIQVQQGILGRICGFGTIVVSGAGNPQGSIPYISNPLKFRRQFVDEQERVLA